MSVAVRHPAQPQFLARGREIAGFASRSTAPRQLWRLANESEGSSRGALYIYDTIGYDWWTGGGITAVSVVAALEKLKGVKTLDIFVNSPGGDVHDGVAILENLKRCPAEKVVHIDGLAASAASLIAMAGDKIVTAPAGMWMVHEAWTCSSGGADDFRKTAEVLDIANGAIAQAYAHRTGLSVEECREVMRVETWMGAAEALELGFTDAVACPDCGGESCTCSEDGKETAAAASLLTRVDERLAAHALAARHATHATRIAQLHPTPRSTDTRT